MAVKIICCDIDGTLLTDDKRITDENRYWIKRAVEEKGVKFVLVSGRLLPAVRMIYEDLGINGPVSGFNGCALYDEENNVLIEHRMSPETLRIIIDTARRCNMDLILFDGTSWCMDKREGFTYTQKRALYRRECELVDLDEFCATRRTNKIVTMAPEKKTLDNFRRELTAAGLTSSKVVYYPGYQFLEIMEGGFSKGTALEDLSHFYKTPMSEIMAIGDDYNDISMLEKAGISVAVANSVPEALQCASYVSASNNDSGVGKAIAKFVFGLYN
ncbi:MAG: HAD family hydrolase [Sphaerochaetaceae bacterium]|nr:HAD family hydrolase [Sphaerochaetaceae bacterium]